MRMMSVRRGSAEAACVRAKQEIVSGGQGKSEET